MDRLRIVALNSIFAWSKQPTSPHVLGRRQESGTTENARASAAQRLPRWVRHRDG